MIGAVRGEQAGPRQRIQGKEPPVDLGQLAGGAPAGHLLVEPSGVQAHLLVATKQPQRKLIFPHPIRGGTEVLAHALGPAAQPEHQMAQRGKHRASVTTLAVLTGGHGALEHLEGSGGAPHQLLLGRLGTLGQNRSLLAQALRGALQSVADHGRCLRTFRVGLGQGVEHHFLGFVDTLRGSHHRNGRLANVLVDPGQHLVQHPFGPHVADPYPPRSGCLRLLGEG